MHTDDTDEKSIQNLMEDRTNLALIHPRLFKNLILIEPIIQALVAGPVEPQYPSVVFMSAYRRDRWPSREEAAKTFQKMYKNWDKRVVDLFLQHGLRDIPASQQVTLSTPKLHELSSYYRPKFSRELPDLDPDLVDTIPWYRTEANRTLKNLPHLRPPTTYLFGKQDLWSVPEKRREKIEMTGIGVGGSGVRAEEVVLDGGHFLPLESPGKVGEVCAERIGRAYRKWIGEEERFKGNWKEVGKKEISEDWLEKLEPFVEGKRGGRKAKL